MSNIPENEKNEAVENEEVLSTVFSNPEEHRKIETVKKKKPLVKILAFFLSLVILTGGTVAVIKLIPEREEDDDYVPLLEEIDVINLKSNTFDTVTLKNSSAEFNFYSEEVEKTDTSSESEERVVNWYLKGYGDDVISSPTVSEKIEGISLITAIRKINDLSDSQCGLDSPVIEAEIKTTEGKVVSMLIGSASPDKTGYYFKSSESEDIFLISEETKQDFEFETLDLANADVLKGFPLTEDMKDYMDDNSDLSTFDTVTISGKNFDKSLVIVPNPENTLVPYIITSPSIRRAQNVENIFNAFKNGITPIGAYALDTSANTLKEFGLSNPDFVMTMKAGNKTHTFKFALQKDGNYAVVCDGEKLVKKVSADNLSYVNLKETDFYSTWVCLEYITELSAFEIKYGDKSYEFIFESAENEEGETEITKVTLDGKGIDVDEFKAFYQECISINCTDFSTDKISEKADYTINFKFIDKTVKTYEFYKSGATKYQYAENGVDMGKVNSSALNKIIKALEDLV